MKSTPGSMIGGLLVTCTLFLIGSNPYHRWSLQLRLHSFTLLSKATYNKNVCQKKVKQQFIAVGTLKMFMEPSAKH